jgi:hypothetical protein
MAFYCMRFCTEKPVVEHTPCSIQATLTRFVIINLGL